MVFLNRLILALAAPLTNHGVPSDLAVRGIPPIRGDGQNPVALRIMPLGASITSGQGSSNLAGYRLLLRMQLTGNPVNMVGDRKAGNGFVDNDNEGWHGDRIDQIHEQAVTGNESSVARWKPNVVLLNAGTNDATQHWGISGAGARMESMIRDIWVWSPRATVFLSTLVLNQREDAERNVLSINKQFRELAKKLAGEDKRIVLVEMHHADGPTAQDMVDDTHPNDAGYVKMARIWLRALVEVGGMKDKKGHAWLQAPEYVKGVPDNGGS